MSSSAQRRRSAALILALVLTDLVALTAAVVAAGLLRGALDEFVGLTALAAERHVLASVLVLPVLFVLFRFHGLYDLDRILAGTREYMIVVQAVSNGLLAALAVSYFAGREPLVSRSWLVLVWFTAIGVVGLGRFLVRRVVRALRRHGRLRRTMAIVGASTFGVAIAQQLRANVEAGYDVVGLLDEYLPLGHRLVDDLAVIGRPGDLLEISKRIADEYIVVPHALPHQRLDEITHAMAFEDGPSVRIAVSSVDLLTNGVVVGERGGVPLVTLQRARLTGIDAALKRLFDIAGAVAGLIVLAPMAVAALLRAWLTGIRPLVQRQRIHGLHGRRTELVLLHPRVTVWLPVRGALALLAVLVGKMSIVGPRPVSTTDGSAQPHRGLIAIRPGLTGPWRLTGPDASLEDQETRDLLYVRNYSIWEDVRIVWDTARRMAPRRAPLSRWQATPASARSEGPYRTSGTVATEGGNFADGKPL